ncbi:MAG: hypothetical protein F6K41_07250 [Symploca sp. SIO3E6]|nr:hypothetical protein [Caldora sp. SIO3E6]
MGERKKGWGAEERRSGGVGELIIFGYKAQEIPPKISFTPEKLIFMDDGEIFSSPTPSSPLFVVS